MRVPKHTSRGWTRAAPAALLAVLSAALVFWLAVIPATHVQAATYTVTSTNDVDDGTCSAPHCSLREAINAANGTVDDDVIAFSTSGAIVLAAALPAITDDDLTINGGGQQVSLTAPGNAFSVHADRVKINNLVIDGEGIGSLGIGANNFADDLLLDSVTVRDFTGDGFLNAIGSGAGIIR